MSADKLRLRLRVVLPALLRLAILGALAWAVGLLFGARAGLWFAVALLSVALAFYLGYLSLLGVWLDNPRLDEIPEGMGAWGEVFTRLYKARRDSEVTQRRLLDNEERFRRTISALPEGILLVDAALQIEWCNPEAERHLGISLRADQGLRLTNLVRDPAFVAFMTSARFEEPLVFRPLARPALVLSVGVIEFEPTRSIVITRDITQTERVDAMRRDFVANVSHELRTPLTVVNGFLETLLDSEVPLDDLRRRHLQLMHEQAGRMNRLIEDLLMLSRLESQESALLEEDVDMPLLLREVADEARALSNGRHTIELACDPAHVRGSRDELRSAVGNLVSNAIRYTPAGGSIRLSWRMADDGALVSVQDTGIGVAPEHVPRLTERFYRVDKSRSRETGGTGLGLAIVKHVLLRHDGRLEVESTPGVGSTFSAWLPRARVINAATDLRIAQAA
jgi:two-component system, OmpR family, phosphate regulon sensor histidine kinase PhoR